MKAETGRPLESPIPVLTIMSRSMEQVGELRQKDGLDTDLSPNGAAKEFDHTFRNGVALARTMVQDSLALQKQWVDGCCKLTADMKTAPPEVQRTLKQMNDTLSMLIDVRATLWEQWFDNVSGLENASMPALINVLDVVEQAIANDSTPPSGDDPVSATEESAIGSAGGASGAARQTG